MELRSVSAICIDADNNSEDRHKLYALLSEIKSANYYYKESEIDFMTNHIQGYIENLDPRIIKFDDE